MGKLIYEEVAHLVVVLDLTIHILIYVAMEKLFYKVVMYLVVVIQFTIHTLIYAAVTD